MLIDIFFLYGSVVDWFDKQFLVMPFWIYKIKEIQIRLFILHCSQFPTVLLIIIFNCD